MNNKDILWTVIKLALAILVYILEYVMYMLLYFHDYICYYRVYTLEKIICPILYYINLA